MNPEDRQLIVSIGRAARRSAMYRELLDVARRYQDDDELQRITEALQRSDATLHQLLDEALEDREAGPASDTDADPS